MATTEPGFDLAIIGTGSAAFAAALAATRQGRRVIMAERGTIGGTCVNAGCVPSKALLAAAEARHASSAAERFPGLAPAGMPVNFAELITGKDALVGQLRTQKYTDLADGYGWHIVHGTATFTGNTDAPALDVALTDGGIRRIEADQYVIATGSAPWAPPVESLKQSGYLTSTTAMELDALPESMIVVGGNAIGLEQAQLFARLGTRVTVVEAQERLAPFEEPEVSAMIERVLADEGITVHTSATLAAVRTEDGAKSTVVRAGDGTELDLRAEQLLIATGRRPNTSGLGLDAVGVKTGTHSEVIVDGHQRTTTPRIWAAGDVVGGPQFVYVAAAQGTLAADNALAGAARTLDYTALPRVTFTSPAIASVGMTEVEAAEAGIRHDSRTLPLAHVPRALADRDTRGLVKLVADTTNGRLIGVHVIADGAGDLITAATYALTSGMTTAQLAHTWTPYLTMAEALKLAAQTFTTDVTKLSCCAD
ncbi:mercury(II) reductase [Streptomyces sp. NPDC048142]|uniref:mercury(II) reductase n=1 Tax=Streptomyces sp. NPDC048142 TaxID=3365501 RepID=UPI00371492BC